MAIVVDPDWWKKLFDEVYLITDARSVCDKVLTCREVDVICAFATDGRIDAYDLFVLKDDQGFFPRYLPCPVVRKQALELRSALDMPLVLLGGINRRESIEQAMGEGFDFVAMGRGLLRDPGFVKKMAKGSTEDSRCDHCNKCMASIFTGTRCVLDEPTPPKIA